MDLRLVDTGDVPSAGTALIVAVELDTPLVLAAGSRLAVNGVSVRVLGNASDLEGADVRSGAVAGGLFVQPLCAAAGKRSAASADESRVRAALFEVSNYDIGRVRVLGVERDSSQLREVDGLSGGNPFDSLALKRSGNGPENCWQNSSDEGRRMDNLVVHCELEGRQIVKRTNE